MADGIKPLVVAFILAALYFVAIVSFMGQVSTDNNITNGILTNPAVNSTFNEVKVNITNTQTVVEAQSQSQDVNNPIALFDFLFESVIDAIKVFKTVVGGFFTVLMSFISEQLGIPDIVMYVLGSILLVVLILLAWRAWKTGQ